MTAVSLRDGTHHGPAGVVVGGAAESLGVGQDVAAYLWASRSRHVPPLASMLTPVSRARRRCSGT